MARALGFTVTGLDETRRKIANLGGKEKDRIIFNGIRRFLHAVRNEAVDRFRQRGIGRRIFARDGLKVSKGRKGARLYIKRDRVRKSGEVFESGMKLTGLAALQETGGRTAAHQIKSSKPGNILSRGKGGGFLASTKSKAVQHPGANVARIPFFVPAFRAKEPDLPREIERGFEKAAAEV